MSINQGSQVNINNRLRSKILSFAIDKEDMLIRDTFVADLTPQHEDMRKE